MIIVDKKCPNCNTIVKDLFADDIDNCSCGHELKRIFGFQKQKEFVAGLFDNFEHDPIYIDSRQQYSEECDKRGLVCTSGAMAYDSKLSKRKHSYDLSKPKKVKVSAEQAAIKACNDLGIE